MTLLVAEGLTVGYHGLPIVRSAGVQVAEGEVVALLGANGAGKTTTLLGISGLARPLAGRVELHGEDVSGLAPERIARRGLAHVPEDRSLFPELSSLANLQLGQHSRRRGVEGALELFPELEPLLGRRAGLLSGGEQQMLAIARALAGRPQVLMIDEMSLGLAPLVTARLFAGLRDIAERRGCGLLLVEQQVQHALSVADRGYVMSRGQVVLEGTAADLSQAAERLEASYLGDVPPKEG